MSDGTLLFSSRNVWSFFDLCESSVLKSAAVGHKNLHNLPQLLLCFAVCFCDKLIVSAAIVLSWIQKKTWQFIVWSHNLWRRTVSIWTSDRCNDYYWLFRSNRDYFLCYVSFTNNSFQTKLDHFAMIVTDIKLDTVKINDRKQDSFRLFVVVQTLPPSAWYITYTSYNTITSMLIESSDL